MPKKIIPFPQRIDCVPEALMKSTVSAALREDLGEIGDITSLSTLADIKKNVISSVISREEGVVCGLDIFISVYKQIDPLLVIKKEKNDGDLVIKDDILIEISGNPVSITSGERTALNFLGLLSGISTNVHSLVSLIKGSSAKLLDTRKTLPNLRLFQKYAVAKGGGYNHRMGLFDMVLIKDNHITSSGGIEEAVRKARNAFPDQVIEVEIRNSDEVREALFTDADIIMLDNMDNENVKKAITLIKNDKYIEISGNIDRNRLVELANLGVDFISMGALTHNLRPLDLSLLIK
jgi:nicotinate-nucleotide pyrophosphorylase (carboxylating)